MAGCVGTGVPFAIASQVVHPDKPVICLQGDWAFGFNGMDIETAARFKLPIVWVIFQNANIDKWVRTHVEKEEDPNDFTPSLRFDVMMEALGGHGEFVQGPEEIRPALERATSLRDWRSRRASSGRSKSNAVTIFRLMGADPNLSFRIALSRTISSQPSSSRPNSA